ncbi:MAG: hypothetical protein K2Y37_10805 [Pirellulales bacterium]|nr:hypothetical protein [Pirellulales bacterium]
MMAVEAFALGAVAPVAWQVAEGQISRSVQSAGGDARYTVDLLAGQRIAFSARADAVNLTYSLIGPTGNMIVSNVAGAGRTMLLNPYYITTPGTYTIALAMPQGGSGNYWLQVAVNSGLEGTGTAAGMDKDLNFSYIKLGNGIGRYAWLGQASASSPTDSFTVDLSSKVGSEIDIALASRGPNFSAQTLELLAPDGYTIVARGTAWSPEGSSTATGLRIAGFTVPVAGKYTLRFTSSVAGAYSLVVSDSVDVDRPTAAAVLNYLVANGLTTQTSVTTLVNTLDFNQVFVSMSADELLDALVRSGLVGGYTSVAAIKAALPSRGVDLSTLRPDGILTALSLADGGSLLISSGVKLSALQAKSLLQTSFSNNRVAFLDVLSTRDLLLQFDSSILTSAVDPRSEFYAYTATPVPTGSDNIIPWYIMWLRDSVGNVNAPTPQEAWTMLAAQPAGRRVMFLADFMELAGFGGGLFGNDQGYIDPVGANGQPTDYYMIWMDQWVAQASAWLRSFLTQYKALGGKLDMLVVDIEHGFDYHTLQFYEQRIDPNAPITRTLWEAMAADPRWPAVKARLLAAGLTEADFATIEVWDATGRQAAIWNAVMEERQAEYLNRGIFDVVRSVFPEATVSNYSQYYRSTTIPSGTFYGSHSSSATVGTILGNAQSAPIYGFQGPIYTETGTLQPPIPFDASIKSISYTPTSGTVGYATVNLFQPITGLKPGMNIQIENRGSYWINPAYEGRFQILTVAADARSFTYRMQVQSAGYVPQSADLTYRQTSVRSAYVNFWQPYQAMISDVKLLRTQAATSSVPILPWVSSADWLKNATGDDYTYYVEGVFQAALSGARDFLWWKQAQGTDTTNATLLRQALKELDVLVGFENRTPLALTDARYGDGYVLSGMDAGGRRIYRLTPDPTQAVTVLSSLGTVSIQVGGKLIQIPNAYIHSSSSTSSTLGYWIIQTTGTTQLRGSVDQLLAKIEAATKPTIGVDGYVMRGLSSTYTLRVPAAFAASNESYSFAIDWDGNGTVDQTVVGPSGVQVMRAYTSAGAYKVGVTATPTTSTKPVGFSTTELTVNALVKQPNEQIPTLSDLVFSGVSGRDQLDFVVSAPGSVTVSVRTFGVLTSVTTYTGINGRFIIYGLTASGLTASSLTQPLPIQFRSIASAAMPTAASQTPSAPSTSYTGPVATTGSSAMITSTLFTGLTGLTGGSSTTAASAPLASSAIDAVLAEVQLDPAYAALFASAPKTTSAKNALH